MRLVCRNLDIRTERGQGEVSQSYGSRYREVMWRGVLLDAMDVDSMHSAG